MNNNFVVKKPQSGTAFNIDNNPNKNKIINARVVNKHKSKLKPTDQVIIVRNTNNPDGISIELPDIIRRKIYIYNDTYNNKSVIIYNYNGIDNPNIFVTETERFIILQPETSISLVKENDYWIWPAGAAIRISNKLLNKLI
jgi:hypothetical protein